MAAMENAIPGQPVLTDSTKRKVIGMSYRKVCYWSEEDQAYIVSVPTLPGCMTDGETPAEAFKKADVVIQEWLDFARELHNEIPEEDIKDSCS